MGPPPLIPALIPARLRGVVPGYPSRAVSCKNTWSSWSRSGAPTIEAWFLAASGHRRRP